MTETETIQSPAVEIAAAQPKEVQPRTEAGKYAEKPPTIEVNTPIQAAQQTTREISRDALREAFGIKAPEKALDRVEPKGKDQPAKTDPASKEASATAKAKPESSSKEATRIEPKKLDKARKALELEGLSEEKIAALSDEMLADLGEHFQAKHAKADREKREAAEAAKKATKPDPAKSSATDSSTASEQPDDDLAELIKAADEDLKGFEAETEDGTKRYRAAQAKFLKTGLDRVETRLKAEFKEQLENLTRGVRGETALNRALDRIAIDIPQVDEPDVRQKLTNRIAALASDPDTAEELRTDIRAVVRREAVALGLKDQRAEREKAAEVELNAAKDAGQPFTGHRQAGPEPEPTGMNLYRSALRDAFSKPRPG